MKRVFLCALLVMVTGSALFGWFWSKKAPAPTPLPFVSADLKWDGNSGMYVLTVKDPGKGIPPGEIRLYDFAGSDKPYWSLKKVSTSNQPGKAWYILARIDTLTDSK